MFACFVILFFAIGLWIYPPELLSYFDDTFFFFGTRSVSSLHLFYYFFAIVLLFFCALQLKIFKFTGQILGLSFCGESVESKILDKQRSSGLR